MLVECFFRGESKTFLDEKVSEILSVRSGFMLSPYCLLNVKIGNEGIIRNVSIAQIISVSICKFYNGLKINKHLT